VNAGSAAGTSHYISAADGTRLFVQDAGSGSGIPLLCLAGLTRNNRDFEPVITTFGETRRIFALDFRGRGQSDHAADPATYRPGVELADTIAVLDALKVGKVAILGTSRGGIVGTLMAALHPDRLAGLFLNDIGPHIEATGVLRIIDYAGRTVSYADWPAAARSFAAIQHGFAPLSEAEWIKVVKRIYVERDGAIWPAHDPRLMHTFPSRADVEQGKLTDFWELLPALSGKPLTCLRGENSDLLSQETVAKLQALMPQAASATVPGRGHVPFLDEPESIAAIAAWLDQVDLQNG
jgi:pimeloyl-ACP methyl ester carboxylesterase